VGMRERNAKGQGVTRKWERGCRERTASSELINLLLNLKHFLLLFARASNPGMTRTPQPRVITSSSTTSFRATFLACCASRAFLAASIWWK